MVRSPVQGWLPKDGKGNPKALSPDTEAQAGRMGSGNAHLEKHYQLPNQATHPWQRGQKRIYGQKKVQRGLDTPGFSLTLLLTLSPTSSQHQGHM